MVLLQGWEYKKPHAIQVNISYVCVCVACHCWFIFSGKEYFVLREFYNLMPWFLTLGCSVEWLGLQHDIAWGTRWRSWLRHCATSRKVTGSIPDGVIGIFHWRNPSSRTMALGLTQPLTEMSTRNISWGVKAAGAYGWRPCRLHMPIVLKSGSLNLVEPSGLCRPLMGLHDIAGLCNVDSPVFNLPPCLFLLSVQRSLPQSWSR